MAREANGATPGYSPTKPGYDAAVTTPTELPSRHYRPTPRAIHQGGNPGSTPTTLPAGTLPPTTGATSATVTQPPTSQTASLASPPPKELSAADFEALFDEIVGLYARPETPRKVPKEKPSGRTLDELLQSPIWELELTCSPIKETPEKTAPEEPRISGRPISRQLFPEDDRENQAANSQPPGSGHLARLAPGRKIKLIPPPPEDPQTRRRPTRPRKPPTKPRGPNTRCLGSPVRAKLAPRHALTTRPHPYHPAKM